MDSPDDAEAWADAAWASKGAIQPVLSANIHGGSRRDVAYDVYRPA